MEVTFVGYSVAGHGCVKKVSRCCNLNYLPVSYQLLAHNLLFISGSILLPGMWRPCCALKIRATPKGTLGVPSSPMMVCLQALGGREKGMSSGAGKPVFNLRKGCFSVSHFPHL